MRLSHVVPAVALLVGAVTPALTAQHAPSPTAPVSIQIVVNGVDIGVAHSMSGLDAASAVAERGRSAPAREFRPIAREKNPRITLSGLSPQALDAFTAWKAASDRAPAPKIMELRLMSQSGAVMLRVELVNAIPVSVTANQLSAGDNQVRTGSVVVTAQRASTAAP